MRDETEPQRDIVTRRMKQGFMLFAIIGGFFIVAEHRAHLIPYLPWLFLAACPLMHVFMHHGHGGHGQHGGRDAPDVRANAVPGPGFTAPSGPGYTGSDGTAHLHDGERSRTTLPPTRSGHQLGNPS